MLKGIPQPAVALAPVADNLFAQLGLDPCGIDAEQPGSNSSGRQIISWVPPAWGVRVRDFRINN